ncbi:unnamed protein product [Ceutorhynchus assimilis]|uniref:UBA domain-containing protein n=1 Tax=Ceutorhynchus assimilis TaxID=467358 RepID=A0A9N9QEC7_9CUCU|nr:unnamed protein product [Ceutorhynchus assimilis]
MANSYADGIKVKISEKYKPPCRISMPISYSQRLTLNKQIQDSRPSYNFNLERSALEKVNEVKGIRKKLAEERKQRLEAAKQEFDEKIDQEKSNQLEKEQAEAKIVEESKTTEAKYTRAQSNTQDYSNRSNSSQIQPNYITKNGILMPIPVTNNYSTTPCNMLMPTTTLFQPQQPTMSKSFNLSDFESDTSSPFDNMELKSINDLEELAQVLKSDRNTFQQSQNVYPSNSVYQNYSSGVTKSFGNLPANSYQPYSQPNSGTPQNSLAYNGIPNTYSQVNNIYNPHSTTYSQYNNPYANQSSYSVAGTTANYNNQINGYIYNVPPQNMANHYPPYSIQKSNCKSVPDLVKSVEKELDATHLNDTVENSRHSISSSYYTTDVPVPTRPKSTDSVYPKTRTKDDTLNPLIKLTKEQREICKNVSLMGFPLDRVVRVCETVGSDQKKIVDHLLALSELLDLGFAEKDASEALMRNDNNRDKALDLLIS